MRYEVYVHSWIDDWQYWGSYTSHAVALSTAKRILSSVSTVDLTKVVVVTETLERNENGKIQVL